MSGLTLARLRRIARAAGGRERRLTILTGTDGRRWAAWPYGCIGLTDQQHGWLDRPVDGCYRWRSDGLALVECGPVCNLSLLRREMLPLLTATGRMNVVPTRWMYEDRLLTRRLLERFDRQVAVVDADLWQLWSSAVGGPVYQVGGRHGALVWASAGGAPGVAVLLPVHSKVALIPPEVAA